jgi:phosphopantetheinyl transferase
LNAGAAPDDAVVVVEVWRIAAEVTGDEIRARAATSRQRECSEHAATSVSHTRGLTVLAGAPVRVGVDVELVREHRYLDRLAQRAMTDAEWWRWRAEPGPDRARAFTQHWTRVEAYLKAIGVGVRGGLLTRPSGSWTVLDLAVGHRHCGALAVEAAGRPVQVLWRVLPLVEDA